jgi:hypothetical protein
MDPQDRFGTVSQLTDLCASKKSERNLEKPGADTQSRVVFGQLSGRFTSQSPGHPTVVSIFKESYFFTLRLLTLHSAAT